MLLLQLAESRILFFGRKFEAIVNQGIINKLESWLYPNRFETHYPTMDRFWLSLYHHHDLSPKPDDALVTLGLSLARVAAKKFAQQYNCSILDTDTDNEQHSFPPEDKESIKLIEMTAYNHDDQFGGILIRFSADVTKQTSYSGPLETFTVSLESWFRLENHVEIAPWSKIIAKYRSKIQVRLLYF